MMTKSAPHAVLRTMVEITLRKTSGKKLLTLRSSCKKSQVLGFFLTLEDKEIALSGPLPEASPRPKEKTFLLKS